MKKNRNQPIRDSKPKDTGKNDKQLTPGPGTRYYEKRKGLGQEGGK